MSYRPPPTQPMQVPHLHREGSGVQADRSEDVQKRWGASKIPSKISRSVEAGKGWPGSSFESIAAERDSERDLAVRFLLRIKAFLEKHGVIIGSARLVDTDEDFQNLIRPRRPGTTLRNCRMFFRFINFYEGRLPQEPFIQIDSKLIWAWIDDLMRHKVGKYTPRLALGCRDSRL